MVTPISSGEKIQRVAFMRHGVAQHNLPDPVTGNPPNPEDPKLFDPPLVFAGKKQALEAGERLRQWWHTQHMGEPIQMILTSPLTRCLQTTQLGFMAGDAYTQNIAEPRIYCTEIIRESFGMHYPDKRRAKSLLQKSWPGITFDSNMGELDQAWKEDRRETINEVANRVQSFLNSLAQQQETNVVVVSHGIWIEVCFHKYCPETLDFGKRRVHNCNVFVAELVSKNGMSLRLQNVRRVH